MKAAFQSSSPLLLVRKPLLLPHHHRQKCVHLPSSRSHAIPTAIFQLGSVRNLTILATAAVALRLPMPAQAVAPTISTPPTSTQLFNAPRISSTSAPLRVHPTRSGVAAAIAPAPVSFAERLAFWVDEFLMWNPAAKVLALLAVTLLCMYLGSFLYRMADPEGKEAAFPFWHSVRAIANPLEDDWEKNSLRTTSIALAAIGMVVFAILVGMVTESVESAVRNVDGEMSRVVVHDHIVVCGWNPHVSQILKDVKNVASKVKVVVLANSDLKERMMNDLRDVLSEEERGKLRVFYRPGAPIVREDLDRVGAAWAKKILLVNSDEGDDPVDADRKILSRALALRQNIPQFSGDIVAELNNVRDEAILRSILANTSAKSVETVNAEQLLFRFMAQAIRQPGLADVVANLMGDDPSFVFHVMNAKEVAPQLVGTQFSDIRPTSIPGSVLCGFFDKTGQVHIGTGKDMPADKSVLEANTPLLLLGKKDSAGPMAKRRSLNMTESLAARMQMRSGASQTAESKDPESFLICGWRYDMKYMLAELDAVLAPGSKVTILDDDAPQSMSHNFQNLKVNCVKKRADRYENLEALINTKTKPYDHVVLIGSAYGLHVDVESSTGQEQDTKTLASLVYVNELLSNQYAIAANKKGNVKPAVVTVEFINERVAAMTKDQGNVTNAILPQNLSAKIAAQTVRDSRLNSVWKELLSQRGREVYLRPCSMYSNLSDEHYSFAAVVDNLATKNDDIVIGYIAHDGRVVINPQGGEKFNTRAWDKRDLLIVLSED